MFCCFNRMFFESLFWARFSVSFGHSGPSSSYAGIFFFLGLEGKGSGVDLKGSLQGWFVMYQSHWGVSPTGCLPYLRFRKLPEPQGLQGDCCFEKKNQTNWEGLWKPRENMNLKIMIRSEKTPEFSTWILLLESRSACTHRMCRPGLLSLGHREVTCVQTSL